MSYPGALDDTQDLLIACNNLATTCIGFVDSGQASIAIINATGMPASGIVSIENEVIAYGYIDVSGSNPVLSDCTRGFDNTSAAQHVAGTAVEMRWVAAYHNTLATAILELQGALGINPQGSAATLAALLAMTLPVIIPTSNGTTWTFTHSRKRVVNVQLWRLVNTNQYELFDAAMTQEVNLSGDSTVTIELAIAEEGYVIYS